MALPEVFITRKPFKDAEKPYMASICFKNGTFYAAEAASTSEALLLVAAHWHSRAAAQSEDASRKRGE